MLRVQAAGCRQQQPTLPLHVSLAPLLQLSHVRLQARGRAAAKSSAELAAVQQQLERYCGLPADMDGAHSATQAKRAELQRLRAQLREHLDGLA